MTSNLTVIIPVRSMAGLLRDCLAGLTKQLQPEDRVIVVDDGSTDNTAQVAKSMGAEVLPGSGTAGPYAARNRAAAAATTPLLLFVDARCKPLPGLVESHREMLGRPGVVLSCTAVRVLPGPSFAGRVAVSVDAFRLDTKVGVPGRLDFFPTANLGVAKSALDAVGGFDEHRSGGDALLCWRIQGARLGTMAADPTPLMEWTARSSLRGVVEQTFRYGRSFRRLEASHAEALATADLDPARPRPPHRPPVQDSRAALAVARGMNLAFRAGQIRARFD